MKEAFINTTEQRIRDRRNHVFDLVRAGYSEREIARKLGVSRSTVWNDKQAMKAASHG